MGFLAFAGPGIFGSSKYLCLQLLFLSCAVRHVGSYFPNQGSNPTPPALEAQSLNHRGHRGRPIQLPSQAVKCQHCMLVAATYALILNSFAVSTSSPFSSRSRLLLIHFTFPIIPLPIKISSDKHGNDGSMVYFG